jgi:ATP-dependent Lhr-like helicase
MISDRDLVKSLGRVGAAFFHSFPELRQSQRQSIPPILAGKNVLLACPTASGKTEAVFAPLIASILAKGSSVDRVRLIAVAPTRALVNDLHQRLTSLLQPLGLSCARQTSDHHSGQHLAFVLITTPESLDSLLSRRSRFAHDGVFSGHDMDSVEAVFSDEAHLFDSSARGDQLCWLLARLRRLKCVVERGIETRSDIQVCGASATVTSPMDLACRLLGGDCEVVSVAGARELVLFDNDDGKSWHQLSVSDSASSLVKRILLIADTSDKEAIADGIWKAMSADQNRSRIRKVLVFVPSRGLCDELSTVLKQHLRPLRQISVFSHHGSLDKRVRETSEQGFSQHRDAVLIATSTLEVGVDIGDVDAVVLIGPPPNTNGLLQRVGRAGRREGITRVVAMARNQVERLAIASMLVAARDGICDPTTYGRRWSVCVQQISSFVRQAPTRGRRIADVKALAEDVWDSNAGKKAESIVQHLVDKGLLARAHGDRVTLGEDWQRLWDGMGMHGNIEGGSVGVPVIDATTGEVLAQLPVGSKVPSHISFGGSNWSAVLHGGELVLTGLKGVKETASIKYSSRRAPMSRHFARHVQMGLGCSEYDLFRCDLDGRTYTFHFGGLIFEKCLRQLFPEVRVLPLLSGIAVAGDLSADIGRIVQVDKQSREVVMLVTHDAGKMLAPGPFHQHLPVLLQREVLQSLFPIEDFFNWASSRRVLSVNEVDAIKPMLKMVISDEFNGMTAAAAVAVP